MWQADLREEANPKTPEEKTKEQPQKGKEQPQIKPQESRKNTSPSNF